MTKSPHRPIRHRERLYLSWWAWPLPLLGAGLLAAQIHMGYPGVRAWLPYVVLIPLAVTVLLLLGRTEVRIEGSDADAELWVGEAHLPLRFAGEVAVIGKNDKRRALGPGLDPAAHLVHRGWIGPLVRVHLSDPDDPTPYWIFSTRHPQRVAELVRASSAAAR